MIVTYHRFGKTPVRINSSLLVKNYSHKGTHLWNKSFLLSIIKKCKVCFGLCKVFHPTGLTPWPASTLLGPRDLEPAAALAKILGFLQVNRTPKPSPASGRNPPQVDSEKGHKDKC
jgi:hypothetical protein